MSWKCPLSLLQVSSWKKCTFPKYKLNRRKRNIQTAFYRHQIVVIIQEFWNSPAHYFILKPHKNAETIKAWFLQAVEDLSIKELESETSVKILMWRYSKKQLLLLLLLSETFTNLESMKTSVQNCEVSDCLNFTNWIWRNTKVTCSQNCQSYIRSLFWSLVYWSCSRLELCRI